MATKAVLAKVRKSMPSPLEQALLSWRVNNGITLELLDKISDKGMAVAPMGSRGHSVARQFTHMHSCRIAWMQYFGAPEAKGIARFRREPALSRSVLKSAFRDSGKAVERYVKRLVESGGRVKKFKGSPLLWLVYLISHDSHHRGQIALSLKQNKMKLPEHVAIGTIWERWDYGID